MPQRRLIGSDSPEENDSVPFSQCRYLPKGSAGRLSITSNRTPSSVPSPQIKPSVRMTMSLVRLAAFRFGSKVARTRLSTFEKTLADIPEHSGVTCRTMFENSFACFESEIESWKVCVFGFQLIDYSQRLEIVFEATVIPHAFI